MSKRIVSLTISFLMIISLFTPLTTSANIGYAAINDTITGRFSDNNTSDTWNYTIVEDGKFTFTATAPIGYNIALYLYDVDNIKIIATDDVDNKSTRTITYPNLAPGKYYVKVVRDGGVGTATYTLANTFTALAVSNDIEPNDANNPNLFTFAKTYYGHLGFYSNSFTDTEDWYTFNVSSDGALSIDVIGQDLMQIRLTVYASDKTKIIDSDDGGLINMRSSRINNIRPGTYYLRIYSEPLKYGTYSISSTFTPQNSPNDYIPNDSMTYAIQSTINTAVSGHLGYSDGVLTDDVDWYKYSTTQDGMIKFDITADQTLLISAEVYEPNSIIPLMVSSEGYLSTRSVNKNGLKSGTYYIKIKRDDGLNYGAYILKATLIPSPYNNDANLNDNYQTASNITINQTTEGHLGYNYMGAPDSTDWYTFTLATAQKVVISTISDSTLNFALTLYGSNGTTLIDGDLFGQSNVRNLIEPNLPAGKYYIDLSADDPNQFGGYSIYFTNQANSLILTPQVQKVAAPEIGVQSQPYSFCLLNTGTLKQTIGQAILTGDPNNECTILDDNISKDDISSGQVKTLTIKYTPKTNNTKTVTLSVPYGSPTISASLSISGQPLSTTTTPIPSQTTTPTKQPTATPTTKPTATKMPTSTPIQSPTPTKAMTTTPTVTITPTATNSPTPTYVPGYSPTATGTSTPSPTPTMSPHQITLLKLSYTSLSLKELDSVSIKAMGVYYGGYILDLTKTAKWTSSDGTIVAFSGKGVVKAMAVGFAKITCEIEGKKVTIKVTVKEMQPIKISPKSSTLTLELGATNRLNITAFYKDDIRRDITNRVKLTASNKNVMVYKNTSLVALKKGKTTITATFYGKKTSYKVIIK